MATGVTAAGPPSSAKDATGANNDLATLPRVALYGDSGALGLGLFSGGYTKSESRRLENVRGFTSLGCGVAVTDDWCTTAQQWATTAVESRTDVAIIYSGAWEVRCLKPLDVDWTSCRTIEDEEFRQYIRRHVTERSTALLDAGVSRVLLAKQEYGPGAEVKDLEHPERWELWYGILDEVAGSDPRIEILDMRPWFRGLADPQGVRYDGYHYTERASVVWRDFLEPELHKRIG